MKKKSIALSSNVTTMSVADDSTNVPLLDSSIPVLENDDPLTCPLTPEKKLALLPPKEARIFLVSRAKYHERCQLEEEKKLDEGLEMIQKAKENISYHSRKRKEINDKKIDLFGFAPKMNRTNSK